MLESEQRLINFLTRSISKEDLDELSKWIKNPKNKGVFRSYVRTHYVISKSMSTSDSEKIKKILLKKMRKDKSLVKVKNMLKYTGVIFLLTSLALWTYSEQNGGQSFLNNREKIVLKDEKITIRLEDGSLQVINTEKNSQIVSPHGKVVGTQKGKELVYSANSTEEIVFNKISVPYGKRFEIVLSDGTKVFLNAGTVLKYPVSFIEGMSREVYLEEGEAFFDVVKGKNLFKVNTRSLGLEVLGTKFNVMAYPEDESSQIVLVEGSVKMQSKNPAEVNSYESNEVILGPGSMGLLDKNSNTIHTHKINPHIYTSWTKGNIVFRKAPFNSIIRKLERNYNLIIINDNEELSKGNKTFNATIELERETIEDVLEYFKEIHDIEYTIINNKIIIH